MCGSATRGKHHGLGDGAFKNVRMHNVQACVSTAGFGLSNGTSISLRNNNTLGLCVCVVCVSHGGGLGHVDGLKCEEVEPHRKDKAVVKLVTNNYDITFQRRSLVVHGTP